jgi:hypothetical protein
MWMAAVVLLTAALWYGLAVVLELFERRERRSTRNVKKRAERPYGCTAEAPVGVISQQRR